MRRGATLAVLLVAIGALVLAASPGIAASYTIRVEQGFDKIDYDITHPGWGGEFEAYTDWTEYYAPSGHMYGYPDGVNFATFCLQSERNISWGTTYTFDDTNIGDPPNGPVARLYDRWYSGTLTEYAYEDTGDGPGDEDSQRALDAFQLQRMLWQLSEAGHYWEWTGEDKYAEWWTDAMAYYGAHVDGVKVIRISPSIVLRISWCSRRMPGMWVVRFPSLVRSPCSRLVHSAYCRC